MAEYDLTLNGNIIGIYDTKQEAAKVMADFIKHNKSFGEELTPFDFCLTVHSELTEEKLEWYRNQRKLDACLRDMKFSNWNYRVQNPEHDQMFMALSQLIDEAKQWNKEDNFQPDFGNYDQKKYCPAFFYDKFMDKFTVMDAPSYSTATSPSLLGKYICFKNPRRAIQFGLEFLDLWNKVLLDI